MKKIFMYRWKAYNYLDIKETFMQLGYEVDEVWQELESYDIDEAFSAQIRQRLKDEDYEFVFTVNYFALISNVCEELHIPYVSWTCDNPLISMYHKSVFNKCNFIFTFDKANYYEFKGMGVEKIFYLPLAVDAKRIEHILSTADDLEAFKNELSFVGSLYERNSYDRIVNTLPEYLRGYFECAMNLQADTFGANVLEECLTPDILTQLQQYYQLDKSEDSFSDLGLIFSTTTLGFKTAQIQRKQALLKLAQKMQVAIYSNSDTSDLIGVDYRGSVDYWGQLPKVFNGSKINLNLTIPNIKTGIPLRIWDILGAGGFLLTNYQPETAFFFEEGVDLVSFTSREDMVRKAEYYLSHDDERESIAACGHKKVLENHTYMHRIQKMLKILGGDYDE